MNLLSHAMSSRGRRPTNEDDVCLAPELGLFAVADGLGGYEGGEVASALTVSAVRSFVEQNVRDPSGTWPCREDSSKSFTENVLRAAAQAAHRAILERRDGRLVRMGSTLASILVSGTTAAIAHVGDSRVYRLRGGSLQTLTRDHSLWAELVAAGNNMLPRHEFPFKNQITRALGLEGNSQPETSVVDLESGDRLLLCTDGLYDPFDDAHLASSLQGGTVEECCQRLVDAAYEAGSADNITALVVDVSRDVNTGKP